MKKYLKPDILMVYSTSDKIMGDMISSNDVEAGTDNNWGYDT